MGLLDDAIREHLELKRRHGADPSEVERQEQEALGPARRGAAPAADAEPGETAGSVGTLDEGEAPGALYDDELEYEDDELEDDLDEPVAATPAAEPEAPVAPPVREDRFDDPPRFEAPPREQREARDPREEPETREPREPADQATVDDRPVPTEADRQDREPPRGPEPDAEDTAGHDVLEETPEFLEETPEHDRLWFEQKPPRDFEF
jgi:hypothetical protein